MNLQEFVDRKMAREIFSDSLDRFDISCDTKLNFTELPIIFNYYGIGGIGKSSLLNWMCNEISKDKYKNRFRYISINTNDIKDSNKEKFLYRLRIELNKYDVFDFDEFDLLYNLFFEGDVEDREYKELHSKIYGKNDNNTTSVIKQYLGHIGKLLNSNFSPPIIKVPLDILNFVNVKEKEIANYSKTLEIIEHIIDDKNKIINSKEEKIYCLLKYFIKAFQNGLQKEEKYYIITIDDFKQSLNSLSWLLGTKGLVRNISAIWIFGTRNKLEWSNYDLNVMGCEIKAFDEQYCKEYLEINNVTDEKIVNRLIDITKGVPKCLSIAVEHINNLKNKNLDITELSFGNTKIDLYDLYESDLLEKGSEYLEMFRILSTYHKWYLSWIEILSSKYPILRSKFEELKSYSSIEESKDGSIKLNNFIREILYDNPNNETKKEIHRMFFDYFINNYSSKSIKIIDDLEFFVFHSLKYIKTEEDFQKLYNICKTNFINLVKTKDAIKVKELSEDIQAKCLSIYGENSQVYIECLYDYSKILDNVGLMEESEKLDKKILSRLKELENNNKDDLDFMFFLYDIQKSVAYNYSLKESHDEALKYSLEAYYGEYEITKKLLGNLCDNDPFNEDLKELSKIIINCLNISEPCEGNLEEQLRKYISLCKYEWDIIAPKVKAMSIVTGSLAWYYIQCHITSIDAIGLATKIYILRKIVFGDVSRETLTLLNNIGVYYSLVDNKDLLKSIEIGKRAYLLRKETFGDDDFDTLESLQCLAEYYSQKEEHIAAYNKSLEIYNKRIDIIGMNHPKTLVTLSYLVRYACNLQKCEESVQYAEKLYSSAKKCFSDEHPMLIKYKKEYDIAMEKCKDCKEKKNL